MDISENGLRLIEGFEGYSYFAYWDSYGGVWTVGYGETSGVGPRTTQTRAQAEADLRNRLTREYEPAIKNLGVPLNQNQFDALCSFVWNLGPGSMAWNVGQYLRERNYAAAAQAMLAYTRAGGVILPGLVTRRQTEYRLFMTPVPRPGPPPGWHHYNRYPTGPFEFLTATNHRLTVNERGVVQRYDYLYSNQIRRRTHAGEIASLRVAMRFCRDRCWHIAKYLPPDFKKPNPHPAWVDDRYLGWRWQKLNDRLKGAVKLG